MKTHRHTTAMRVPGAFEPLQALAKAGGRGGLPQNTFRIVRPQTSQVKEEGR